MKLLFALHNVEFKDFPHSDGNTMSILSICDIKCCGAALHLSGIFFTAF